MEYPPSRLAKPSEDGNYVCWPLRDVGERQPPIRDACPHHPLAYTDYAQRASAENGTGLGALFQTQRKAVHKGAVVQIFMPSSYTIRMTRGAYVVSAQDAERILRAVETKESHVLVEADAIGDGLYRTPIRLVTAHVLSVAENIALTERAYGPAGSPSLRAVPSV